MIFINVFLGYFYSHLSMTKQKLRVIQYQQKIRLINKIRSVKLKNNFPGQYIPLTLPTN
jgi:hypothetical protein